MDKELFRETATTARVPGRVNLIGEHTDYHQGLVLPAPISRGIVATSTVRHDDLVIIEAAGFGSHQVKLSEVPPTVRGWAARVEGLVRALGLTQGANVTLKGDLPAGAGLSSSAASLAALAKSLGSTLEVTQLAQLIQSVEHRHGGVKCGIMDPLAVLIGRVAMIDCRSLAVRPVQFPEQWEVMVLDTGVRHELAKSEYNRRQEECAEVLVRLGKASLRDVTLAELEGLDASPVSLARCRHVLSENARVLQAVTAIEAADARAVGGLFAASHESLRTDYQVSCPELDAMVQSALASGALAARMTGAGFGGCTVNLIERAKRHSVVSKSLAAYQRATGRQGRAV